MLEAFVFVLIILWLLGMASGYMFGGFIWILLIIAMVIYFVRLVRGGQRY